MSRNPAKPLWSHPENLILQLHRFVGLDDAALALVRRHAEVLSADADKLASLFYDYLLSHSETADVFDTLEPQRLQQLVDQQAQHFRAMLADWPHSAKEEAEQVAHAHYRYGVSPTWVAGAYNLYREHLDTRLQWIPAEEHDALRQAVYRLLVSDMMLQLAALESAHEEGLAERSVITQALLETTLKLAELPTPEEVFASICTDLVSRSRHLPAVWFSLVDENNSPLRPYFCAGTCKLWKGLEVPYDPEDPLWRALEENRSIVLRKQPDQSTPVWWPETGGVEAVALFPFGHIKGIRGLGVVYADHAWYFDRVDLAPFSAFTRLGQVLLGLKENQLRDPLTGLPNRTLFLDRLRLGLTQSQRRQKLLGIGMIDLDGFKEVNDRLGHPCGDELLRLVADRLDASLRQGDTVARLGGDEFGLILADLNDLAEAEQIIQRLLESLEAPFAIDTSTLHIGASLGLTLYPMDDADSQTLIRHADIALYQAKDAGRHRYRIFEHHSEEIRVTANGLQDRFDLALDSGELVFHYQPKVDIALGHTFGAEALVRWQRGDTLIPPDEFIGVIENSPKLIRRLGQKALLEAAAQGEHWRAHGHPLSISVNIGAEHLLNPGFVDDIDEVLSRYPVSAPYLEIEITERAALRDLAQTRASIEACRDRGLTVALDDYGTGHASMTYLQELPANQIKLDKRFVQKLLDEPRALAIIAGSLTSAGLLDLDVIAEGVETIEQGELLLQLGCRQAQGFLIARPMPAQELTAWLEHWQPPAEWRQWHNNLFTQQDLPFLMARTAHRYNLHALLRAVSTPPTPERPFLEIPECVDESHCALGRWLRGAGQRYRRIPTFKHLARLHSRTHAQAIETTLAWQTGNRDALAREVDNLRDTAHKMDLDILDLARQIGLHESLTGTDHA